MPAVFDFDAFSQTAMDVSKVDYDWHSLPDKTESLAQIVKLDARVMDFEKFNNRHVVALDVQWELKDSDLCKEMNMDKLVVRQNVLIELTGAPPPAGSGVPKFGTNENQGLKDLIRAVGLADAKKFNLPMLMHQMGWVITRNKDVEGFERKMTEVYVVKDAKAGRASYEAKLSKANGA